MAAIGAIAIGLLVLLGWASGLQALRSFLPGAVPMKANAALLLLLSGTALALRAAGQRPRVVGALAIIVLGVACATALEYVARIDLGIDQLLAPDVAQAGAPYPGRLAVGTAFGFGAGAIALLLLGRAWRGWHPSASLASVAAIIGGLGVLGYAYGASELTSIGSTTQIALPTALGLVVLGGGILGADPQHGLIRILRDPGMAGQLARRLMATALLVLPLAGMLELTLEHAGVFDHAVGTALMVLFQLLILVSAGWWYIDRASRVERSRGEARRERDRVLETSEDLICVMDTAGRLALVSPSWTRHLGYEPNELIGQRIAEFLHPDDLAPSGEAFPAGAAHGNRVNAHVNRGRARDGTYRWLEWNTSGDPETGQVYAAARDISKRKVAEEALDLAHTRLRQLIDSNIVGVVVARADGTFLEANDYYLDLIGYARAEFERGEVDWRSLTPPEWAAADTSALAELRERGVCTPYEKEYELRDGRRVWVYLADTLLPGPSEEIVAFVLDISDRKRAERDVLTLNAELEARVRARTAALEGANQELEAFSYSVSHDLRAPLRSIDAFSQIILGEHASGLDTEGERLLGVVLRNVKHMGTLIDDLLAFSRVARAALEHRPVDMERLAEAVAEEQRAAYPGREITFDVGPLAEVPGDQVLLRQVWANLLGNAAKFTGPAEHAAVEVRSECADGECRYTVRDNGVGFDSTYVDKLFEPFQRLHSTSAFEGTGIGLAIVARIVRRHGGRVWAEGAPGAGATFGFSLPAQPEAV